MTSETVHRCAKCNIVPVYQTATITEPRDDVPGVIYRLQCPHCGQYGGYCTTKQMAAVYWNRETFAPSRGKKK